MQSWVRRSLEAAVLTAGFVAAGAGAAHASAPASGPTGNSSGTSPSDSAVQPQGLPLLSGATNSNGLTDVVENARQLVTNTVDVLSPSSPLTPQGHAPAVKDTSMHMTVPAAKSAAPSTDVASSPVKQLSDTANAVTHGAVPSAAGLPDPAGTTAPLTSTVSSLQGQVPAPVQQPLSNLGSVARNAPVAAPLAQPANRDVTPAEHAAEPIAVKSPGDAVKPIAIPAPSDGLPAAGDLGIKTITDQLHFFGSTDGQLPLASLIKACGSGAGGVVCNLAHNDLTNDLTGNLSGDDQIAQNAAAPVQKAGTDMTHEVADTTGAPVGDTAWGPATTLVHNVGIPVRSATGDLPTAAPQAEPLGAGSPLSGLTDMLPLGSLLGGGGSPLDALSLDTGGNNALPLAEPQDAGSPLSGLTDALPLGSLLGGSGGSPLDSLAGGLPLGGLGLSPVSAVPLAEPQDSSSPLSGLTDALPLSDVLDNPNLVNVDPHSDVTGPFGSLSNLTGAVSGLGASVPTAAPMAQPMTQPAGVTPGSDAALPLNGVLHPDTTDAPVAGSQNDLAALSNATNDLHQLTDPFTSLDRSVDAAGTGVNGLRDQVGQLNAGGEGLNTGLSGLDEGIPGLTGKDLSLTSVREALPFVGVPTDGQDGAILPDASADLGKTLDLGNSAEKAAPGIPGVPATVAGLSSATVPLPNGELPGAEDTSTALHNSATGLKQGTDALHAQTAGLEDNLTHTGLQTTTSAVGDELGLPGGTSDLTGGLKDVGLGDGLDQLGLQSTTLQHRISELTSELGTELGLLDNPVAHPLAEDSSAPVASLGDAGSPLASLGGGNSPLSILGQGSPLNILHTDELPVVTGSGTPGLSGLDSLGLSGDPLSAVPLAQPVAESAPAASALPGVGDLSNLTDLSDLTGNLSGLTGGLDGLGSKGLSGLTGGSTAMNVAGLPL